MILSFKVDDRVEVDPAQHLDLTGFVIEESMNFQGSSSPTNVVDSITIRTISGRRSIWWEDELSLISRKARRRHVIEG